ncbi:MAG: folylpolyglutamate synthase/dihydrofolate synthase family protein [Verrucomicrobiota bacterium]
MKFGLENITSLCNRLGNPQNNLRIIHFAGTNGKGSVIQLVASVLKEASLKVGVYTSPHLISFRERIAIEGMMISKEEIVAWVNKLRSLDLQMTFFEATTAIALGHFNKHSVDWVLLETGMGGRLDATNIVQPELSVITSIGLDHMRFLGSTLEEIATEKAGIIKNDVPVVIGDLPKEARKAVERKARSTGSEIIYHNQRTLKLQFQSHQLEGIAFTWNDSAYFTRLTGSYQQENIRTSCAVLDWLSKKKNVSLESSTVAKGLMQVMWPGRFQVLSYEPIRVLDGAHNRPALISTFGTWMKLVGKKPEIILFSCQGLSKWNELKEVLDKKDFELWLVPLKSPAAIEPGEINASLTRAESKVFTSIKEGWEAAKASQRTILVIGSLYLVGEVISIDKKADQKEIALNWWFSK